MRRSRRFRSRRARFFWNSGYCVAMGQLRQPFDGQLPQRFVRLPSLTLYMGHSGHLFDGQLLQRIMLFVEMSRRFAPAPAVLSRPSLPTRRPLKL